MQARPTSPRISLENPFEARFLWASYRRFRYLSLKSKNFFFLRSRLTLMFMRYSTSKFKLQYKMVEFIYFIHISRIIHDLLHVLSSQSKRNSKEFLVVVINHMEHGVQTFIPFMSCPPYDWFIIFKISWQLDQHV